MFKAVTIGTATIGGQSPLALIAGPCVIESLDNLRQTASKLKEITLRLNMSFIFKSSFDKANRSSLQSYRGPGFEKGLEYLALIKKEFQVPVISDVHETWQIKPAAKVLDALQIPAFLARQTDLLTAAAQSGLPVNVKKGQFMAPTDMKQVILKMETQPGFKGLCLCERGSSFGYHNLVVDMRSLTIMRSYGWPVIFDATHSVQLPSASGAKSGGDRQFIPGLSRAAVAAGLDGLFIETHPSPHSALCDGPNQWPLDQMESLLKILLKLHNINRESEGNFD